jgi:hypothetical protein
MSISLLAISGAALIAGGLGCMIYALRRAADRDDQTGFCFGDPVAQAPAAIALPEPANCNLPDLSPDQMLVLAEMSDDYGRTAARLVADTGLTHAQVVDARRQLRKMGLAIYGPLFDEDTGRPSGSGYLLTSEGVRVRAYMLDLRAAA